MRSRDSWIVLGLITLGVGLLFAVVMMAGTITVGLTVIIFDRYTWPLILPLAVLLLLRPEASGAVEAPASRRSGPCLDSTRRRRP